MAFLIEYRRPFPYKLISFFLSIIVLAISFILKILLLFLGSFSNIAFYIL
jgi:hypothetical protein